MTGYIRGAKVVTTHYKTTFFDPSKIHVLRTPWSEKNTIDCMRLNNFEDWTKGNNFCISNITTYMELVEWYLCALKTSSPATLSTGHCLLSKSTTRMREVMNSTPPFIYRISLLKGIQYNIVVPVKVRWLTLPLNIKLINRTYYAH